MGKKTIQHSIFKQLMREHSKVLTIAGAAIVFVTFVVKDAYRESLKDIAGSIGEVEGTFETNLKLQRVNDVLAVIRYNKDYDADTGLSSDPIRRNEQLLSRSADSPASRKALESYYDLESSSVAISHIMELLPRQIQEEKRPDLNRITHMIREGIRQTTDTTSLSDVEHLMININNGAAPIFIRAEMEDLQRYLLNVADEERRSLDKRLRISTIVSYVLYPLGWLIGLVGKLYGVETGAGDE